MSKFGDIPIKSSNGMMEPLMPRPRDVLHNKLMSIIKTHLESYFHRKWERLHCTIDQWKTGNLADKQNGLAKRGGSGQLVIGTKTLGTITRLLALFWYSKGSSK